MESTATTPTFDDTLLVAQAAADWLQRLACPTADERLEAIRWIQGSPRNVRELLLAAVWDLILFNLDSVSRGT